MLSKAHIIYAIRKLLITIPIFLGTSIAIFYVMNLVGSPIYFMVHISGHLNSAAVEKLAVYYQLDKPLWYRYVVWLGKFVVGDMGTSFFSGESVNVLLSSLSWETVKLQLAAITFAAVLGIPIGVKTALKQYSKTDYCVTAVALAGYSMPIFWSGLLMILIFSYFLNWFPPFGAFSLSPSEYPFGSSFIDELWHLVMPTIVLGYSYVAVFVRLTRSGMLETMRQDYILSARASGLTMRRIVYNHALRNAILPVITYLGLFIALSIAGAPVTETVFTWPGLGYNLVLAVNHLDYPVIMGISMVICIFVVIVNFLTDIVYSFFDPRITI